MLDFQAADDIIVCTFRIQWYVKGRCVVLFVVQCYEELDRCFVVELHKCVHFIMLLAVVYIGGCYNLADVVDSCDAVGWVASSGVVYG